jgi:hypothetical protein
MRTILANVLAVCAIIAMLTLNDIDASPRSPVAPPTVQPVDSLPAGCPCGAVCQCANLRARILTLEAELKKVRGVAQQGAGVPVSGRPMPEVRFDSSASRLAAPVCGPNGCPPKQYAAPTRRVVVSKPVRRGLLGRWKQ